MLDNFIIPCLLTIIRRCLVPECGARQTTHLPGNVQNIPSIDGVCWIIGLAGLLVFYWPEDFKHKFFIFTQPMYTTSGTEWEMRTTGLHFYLGAFFSVSLLPLRCCLEVSNFLFRHFPCMSRKNPLGAAQMVSQKYLGAFPSMFRHKFGHFLYISLGTACLCKFGLKIKAKTKQKPPESHL